MGGVERPHSPSPLFVAEDSELQPLFRPLSTHRNAAGEKRRLGVTKATIYRYVAPDGSLRNRGRQVLAR